MRDFFKIYGRVLGLLQAEWKLTLILISANVALAGLHFLEPLLFGQIINVLASSTKQPSHDIWSETNHLLLIWVGVGLSGVIANILVALHADRMTHRRRANILTVFFEHTLSLPRAYHGEIHSGRLLKVMWQGSNSLSHLWLSFFREHLSTFIALIILIPLSLWLNWRLGLLLIVLILLVAALTVLVISKTHTGQGKVEDYHSELAQRAADAFGNIGLIQSFVRVALEVRQLGDAMQQVLKAQFPVLNWWALTVVLTRIASTLTILAIFSLGTWLYLRGQARVGDIVSFMGFATTLINRTEQAMGFASSLLFQMPILNQFFEVLDTKEQILEKPNAISLNRVKGHVAFERVTFAFDNDQPAVQDLNFSVTAGMTVAIVGPTGAGKTTALALLNRLWDPQSGTIRIDGIDIRDVTLESLRRNIGVVFQDNPMLQRTIAENLRLGRPEASDAEIAQAASLAQAHDFISALPQGYNTPLKERGNNLSGGERQRLAIARALLKDPPILILDEATSALDTVTEVKVQAALSQLMKGRTTFIIAHRLSTIRNADLILVMEQGRLIEQGTFNSLSATQGVFSMLITAENSTQADI